jgi:hypothetical protein
MGYSHYFQQSSIPSQALFNNFTSHALEIIEMAWDIELDVSISPDFLDINGVGAESHENFIINREDLSWNFCKTNFKPYDAVVTAVLILARYTFPDFHLSSDGAWKEWENGQDLFSRVMFLEPAEATVFGMATV